MFGFTLSTVLYPEVTQIAVEVKPTDVGSWVLTLGSSRRRREILPFSDRLRSLVSSEVTTF